MHSINGYVYGNEPMITVRRGQRVRWYTIDMGTEVDLHTPHWHGNTLVAMGMRTDVVQLLPGGMVTADMRPDDAGHLAVPLPRRRPHPRGHADALPRGRLTEARRAGDPTRIAGPATSRAPSGRAL